MIILIYNNTLKQVLVFFNIYKINITYSKLFTTEYFIAENNEEKFLSANESSEEFEETVSLNKCCLRN